MIFFSLNNIFWSGCRFAAPASDRDKGLRRFGGFVQCHGFDLPGPLRDKGLRRFGGLVQCQGFGKTGPVKDKGLRRSSFPCKSHKVREFAAVEHQSLRRFRRDFAMEKDPTPGPFGHQGHESSNKKLPKLLQKSLDFGLGADQNSHCGWILGKLWVLQSFGGSVQLPLSCFNDLEHDWNTVEHHGREAAQSLRWMQKIANVQSCGVQLDREDAKCSPGEGYNVVATHVGLPIDPGVVGFIFQQCHQSARITSQLEGCEFQG